MKQIKRSYIILAILLVVFNVFAIFRAIPVNSVLEMHNEGNTGDYDAKVYKAFNFALENANQPFLVDWDNFTNFGRNPALYKFIAEVFIRLGAQNPFPIQLFAILLFNIGLIIAYLWIKKFFKSTRIAILAIFFLVTSPYLLLHSSTIHQDPYTFLFFNLTIYFYLNYLDNRKRNFLIGTLISYFFLCQNYYMYYISTAILIFGLHRIYTKKWFDKHLIAIYSIPVISMAILFLQTILYKGSLGGGFKSLAEMFAARTIDARIPDSEWNPDKVFVTFKDYLNMPNVISNRVKSLYYIGLDYWFILLGIGLFLNSMRSKKYVKNVIFFIFLIMAGLSWNVIFYQHTYIHGFTGIYSFFLWTCIFAFSINEIWLFISNKFSLSSKIEKLFVLLVVLSPITLIFITGFANTYVYLLVTYIKNIL